MKFLSRCFRSAQPLPVRRNYLMNACFWFIASRGFAGLFAIYDPVASSMMAPGVAPSLVVAAVYGDELYKDIPRTIIISALCDEDEKQFWEASWLEYSKYLNYKIIAITRETVNYWSERLPSSLRRALDRELRSGSCQNAEKIMSWAVLFEIGGIAPDSTVFPPTKNGIPIDLAYLMPFRGLVTSVADRPHNTRHGLSGIALDDAFVGVPPDHPVIRRILESLPSNLLSLHTLVSHPTSDYMAGKVLLTRSMSTPTTVLPRHFFEEFNMMTAIP